MRIVGFPFWDVMRDLSDLNHGWGQAGFAMNGHEKSRAIARL